MLSRFKTNSGWLTPYALACGYVERIEHNDRMATLWNDPGTRVYHVRAHDFENGIRLNWDSFTNLRDARRCFARARKQIRAKLI